MQLDKLTRQLKYREFDFPEGIYVLTMSNCLINSNSVIEISLKQKDSVISIVIKYDLKKIMNHNWNSAKVCWDELVSKRKLTTLNTAMMMYANRDKFLLI